MKTVSGLGKGECSSKARGTGLRNEAELMDTLGHAGPFSQLIHSLSSDRNVWDEIIRSLCLKITLAAIKM